MNSFLIVEISAIVVGLVVIVIESVIIYFLIKHEKSLNVHLEHLNEHSHAIEDMVIKLMEDICSEHDRETHINKIRERRQQGLKKEKPSEVKEKVIK